MNKTAPCSYCGKPPEGRPHAQCPCKTVRYCSSVCQKAHHPVHQSNCSIQQLRHQMREGETPAEVAAALASLGSGSQAGVQASKTGDDKKRKPGVLTQQARQMLELATRDSLHQLLARMLLDLQGPIPNIKDLMEQGALQIRKAAATAPAVSTQQQASTSQPAVPPGFGGVTGQTLLAGGGGGGFGGAGFGAVGVQGQPGGDSIMSAAGLGGGGPAGAGGLGAAAGMGMCGAQGGALGFGAPGAAVQRPQGESPQRGTISLSQFFQDAGNLATGRGAAGALDGMTLEPEGDTSFGGPLAMAGLGGQDAFGAGGDGGLGLGAAGNSAAGWDASRLQATTGEKGDILRNFQEKVELAGMDISQIITFTKEDTEEFCEMYFFDSNQAEVIWSWLQQMRAGR